jgi:hypothetical protein
MPPDPHRISIRAAERSSRELAVLFGKLGTAEHPRGAILRAYRNAHASLSDVLRRDLNGALTQFRVREVFATLRNDVRQAARETTLAASEAGITQATTEAAAWGLEAVIARPTVTPEQIDPWLDVIRQQEAAALAILATSADPVLILGDESRLGVLQPSPVVKWGTRALTAALLASWTAAVEPALEQAEAALDKQAVAAIDERTTETCLNVHGQVKPFDQPYHLTGTPRYADDIEFPPFHDYCRTVSVLVARSEANDELSQAMRQAGRAEREARAEDQRKIEALQQQLRDLGVAPNARILKDDTAEIKRVRRELKAARQRPEIHPASALSRRG